VILRRFVASVAIIFAVVTLVFVLIHIAPGEPCPSDEPVDPAVCSELKQQFGLDRPVARASTGAISSRSRTATSATRFRCAAPVKTRSSRRFPSRCSSAARRC
jgi:ABC-type dipeptide/oligopeptide/nickel transport system permease component